MNLKSLRNKLVEITKAYCNIQADKQKTKFLQNAAYKAKTNQKYTDTEKNKILSDLKFDKNFNTLSQDAQREKLADAINGLKIVYPDRFQHLLLIFELIKKTDFALDFICNVETDLDEREKIFKGLERDYDNFITTFDKLIEHSKDQTMTLECWDEPKQSNKKINFRLSTLQFDNASERVANQVAGYSTLALFGKEFSKRFETIKTSFNSPMDTLESAAKDKEIHKLKTIISEFKQKGVEWYFREYYTPTAEDKAEYFRRREATSNVNRLHAAPTGVEDNTVTRQPVRALALKR